MTLKEKKKLEFNTSWEHKCKFSKHNIKKLNVTVFIKDSIMVKIEFLLTNFKISIQCYNIAVKILATTQTHHTQHIHL